MRFVRSLGTQRIALIALIALPAILLTLRSGLERRDESANRVRDQGLQLARGISQQGELTVRGARELLIPIAALFAESTRVTGVSTDACTAFLSSFTGADSAYLSVGLADASGRVHCADAPLDESVTIADAPYFLAPMAGDTRSVGYFTADPIRGVPALMVGWPVSGANGAQLGVTFVGLNLERFDPISVVDGLPEGSFATIVDREGTILARAPSDGGMVGTPLRESAILDAIRRNGEGTTGGDSAEGVPSLIAFAPIEGFGEEAYAVIGIPASTAFNNANRALLQDLIVMGVISLVALSIAWFFSNRFVLRPVAELVGVTRRIAEGDFSARAGRYAPNEIGELSRAFDSMSEALAARQAEIQDLQATLERRVQQRTADLEAANRELEAFSYSVSHDLRAPLRTISGYGELLATEHAGRLDPEAQQYLAVVRASAAHMDRLIDDLLQFSRVARSGLTRRPAPLAPIVQDALDELRPDIGDRPVEVEMRDLGEALVDSALIRQVFVNLLANAIKFTRGRDPAHITVGRETGPAGETIYFVSDNGVGFDMVHAAALFGVFQRFHTQAEYEGTGVGLATVQRIVERHQGAVWAEAAPDRGATFRFTLGDRPDVDD